jgi:hypothetical protein
VRFDHPLQGKPGGSQKPAELVFGPLAAGEHRHHGQVQQLAEVRDVTGREHRVDNQQAPGDGDRAGSP